MTKKSPAWKRILKDLSSVFFIIAVVYISLKLLSEVSFDFQLPKNLAPWWVWILLLVGLAYWIVLLIIKPIWNFITDFLKSLKYHRWIDFLRSSEETPCDFSPEKPIELSSQDKFRFSHLVGRIFKAIKEYKGVEALIFGINGRLGIGKSSLTNITKEKFRDEKNFIIVSFNPWYYKDVNALLKGFVKVVMKSIKNQVGIGVSESYIRDWETALELTLGLTPSMGLGIKPHKIISVEKAKENIGKWLERKSLKLLIFMDDLDRCNKEEILLTLKLLRYFADFKHTIFVLGYAKEKISEKASTDIEKFVDQEIPLEIEKEVLYNWFWEKAEICGELHKELKKIFADSIVRTSFIAVFFNFFDSPRKVKLILNDLLVALPLVRDKVYFPHFVVVTILKRDMPNLYNILSSGGYWILQEGVSERPVMAFAKGKESFINSIADTLCGEDLEERRKMYRYLTFLSNDLTYNEIRLKNGQRKPEIKQINGREIRLREEKLIWKEGFTETYFLWKESSSIYAEKLFDELLKELQSETEKVSIIRIRDEIERIKISGKTENFLELISAKADKIMEMRLDGLFLKGISGIEIQDGFSEKAALTVLSLISFYPRDEKFKKLKMMVENSANPSFLEALPQTQEVRNILQERPKEKEEFEKIKEKQFDKILLSSLRCLCEFHIPDHISIPIFLSWGNPEKVAQYLKGLSRRKNFQEHGREIIKKIEEASDASDFFRDVVKHLKKLGLK